MKNLFLELEELLDLEACICLRLWLSTELKEVQDALRTLHSVCLFTVFLKLGLMLIVINTNQKLHFLGLSMQ